MHRTSHLQQPPARSRVLLVAPDGWVALDERVTAAELRDEHVRRQLAERLAWAAEDAERPRTAPARADGPAERRSPVAA